MLKSTILKIIFNRYVYVYTCIVPNSISSSFLMIVSYFYKYIFLCFKIPTAPGGAQESIRTATVISVLRGAAFGSGFGFYIPILHIQTTCLNGLTHSSQHTQNTLTSSYLPSRMVSDTNSGKIRGYNGREFSTV